MCRRTRLRRSDESEVGLMSAAAAATKTRTTGHHSHVFPSTYRLQVPRQPQVLFTVNPNCGAAIRRVAVAARSKSRGDLQLLLNSRTDSRGANRSTGSLLLLGDKSHPISTLTSSSSSSRDHTVAATTPHVDAEADLQIRFFVPVFKLLHLHVKTQSINLWYTRF